MSARSYMSIGDVLTLLRQEFPDVTISKIRFLESQGLVNPERTPSGYRKFYEHDVERLRWVLRQQREHFLPLKVIKDRLDDDSGGVQAEAGTAHTATAVVGTEDETHDAPRRADEGSERPVLVGQRAGERTGSTLPGIESAVTSSTTATTTVGTMDAPTSSAPSAAPEAGTLARPLSAAAADPHGSAGGATVGSATRRARPTGGDGEPGSSGRKKPPAPPTGAPGPAGETRPTANGVTEPSRPSSKPGSTESASKGGSNLSVEELASACDLEVAVVRELEEFGLLTATNVAGVESFGEDALAVGRMAAQFARFGVEPRHLRLYKNAADREAGFVEQIVLPLVRQRNPDARARAQDAADELALLGQQLRSSLLRSALGSLLEG